MSARRLISRIQDMDDYPAGLVPAASGSSGTPGASNPYLTQADNALRIRDRLRRVTVGMKHDTFSAASIVGNTAPGTQALVGGLVSWLAGETISGGFVVVGTPQVVTSCWMILFDASDNTQKAVSGDTPALVGTAGRRGVDFAPAFTPVTDGTGWICLLQVTAGASASVARGNNGLAGAFVGVGAGKREYVQMLAQPTPPAAIVTADTTFAIYAGIY